MSASAQNLEDEFCGSTPPPSQVLEAWRAQGRVGHACCTESLCRCTSLICGGPEASLEDQDMMVMELGERLPKPETERLEPEVRELPPTIAVSKVRQPLLEPPTPPPPQK